MLRFASVDRPPEIGQFNRVIDKHNILWLEISMDDSMLVEVHQSFDGLSDIVGGFAFGEESFFAENIEKGGFSNFQYQQNILILFVEFIELQAVLVFQEKLDFYLGDQSLDQLGCHLLQTYLLYCVN